MRTSESIMHDVREACAESQIGLLKGEGGGGVGGEGCGCIQEHSRGRRYGTVP